jgi:sugar transferase EpsL
VIYQMTKASGIRVRANSHYSSTVKPIGDKFFAIILCLVMLPLFIVTSFLVLLSLGRPIFFFQERIGLNEKKFYVIKFRTMANKYDDKGNLLPDNVRLGKVGNFLRRSSLDEIPTLINVILGDMSLVGPRPLLTEYLPYYNSAQRKRHLIKPGVTGLAQIYGRNALNWNEKFALDLQYKEKISFRFDLYILYKTFVLVLSRKGMSNDQNQLVKKFNEKPD